MRSIGQANSVTTLGYFYKILATILHTKVALLFGDLFANANLHIVFC